MRKPARDLGATYEAFLVTLPVMPAVRPYRARTMSMDDVVISIFDNGPNFTLPESRCTSDQKPVAAPEISNALCTIM
ncbi:MAG: hypothetical protein ACLU4P_06285 [Ruminococcus sp.]